MIAIKNLNKQNSFSFLCVRYDNMEFLFMEDQFERTENLHVEKRIKSPIHYISSATRYKGEIVPVFDLDSYLVGVFGARNTDSACRLLVMNFSSFSKDGQDSLRRLKLKNGHDKELLNHLGVRIPGSSGFIILARSEMRILPPLMHEVQQKRGILGLRFLDDGKIQYVLDSEIILFNVISKSGEDQGANDAGIQFHVPNLYPGKSA